ncbi:hypothetical protein ACHAW6_012043 [Cyclotella cf. meneghiniana]
MASISVPATRRLDLERIRRLDPDIQRIELDVNNLDFVEYSRHADVLNDFGSLGHCIGRNKSINVLRIRCHTLFDPQNEVDRDCPVSGIPASEWDAFFEGVSLSQSIKTIYFDRCCLGGHILQLFDIPNVEEVHFDESIITNQTASAVRRVSCLRHVHSSYDVTYWDDTDAADFIASLNHKYKVDHLSLCLHTIEEGEALRDILSDQQCIVKKLELDCVEEIMVLLGNALVNSSSLRELSLDNTQHMTWRGWQVVSDVLSSPVAALKVLRLTGSLIDDKSADVLATGLAHNITLEELDGSSFVAVTVAGWLSVVSSLRNSNLPLKRILFFTGYAINDEVVSLFGEVLTAKRDTIEMVCLACDHITAVGWTALSVAFGTPMPNLKELYLGSSCYDVDDEFAPTNFDDDASVAFASGLNNKPCLKSLDLGPANITPKGWEAISKVLCDASSLDSILESNHTLHWIGGYYSKYYPPNIYNLLETNRSGTPSEVARLKIIKYSDKITMDALVIDRPEMQLKLLPSLIVRLGKIENKQDAIYRFVRNQSYLLEGARKNASAE